mmetsp:Transcript_39908/g.113990  ORF Transcript_39908/g.113990 Transcript_39908/m.113990 type:complete len:218 (-) Transcript_39908:1529-2182(-)
MRHRPGTGDRLLRRGLAGTRRNLRGPAHGQRRAPGGRRRTGPWPQASPGTAAASARGPQQPVSSCGTSSALSWAGTRLAAAPALARKAARNASAAAAAATAQATAARLSACAPPARRNRKRPATGNSACMRTPMGALYLPDGLQRCSGMLGGAGSCGSCAPRTGAAGGPLAGHCDLVVGLQTASFFAARASGVKPSSESGLAKPSLMIRRRLQSQVS